MTPLRLACFGISVLLAGGLSGCASEGELDEGLEDELDAEIDPDAEATIAGPAFPGENGRVCVASSYNCRFRVGGSRVETATGSDSWGIEPGASIRDGNGRPLLLERRTRMTFNYGQTRALAGKAHALALSTSNHSAGWYPIDHIKGETSFREHMGEVNAMDPGLGKLGCYQVRNSHDPAIELRKVVYDSQVGDAGHERAGDYLSLLRRNGLRSANLLFSVPGFGLGGATTDHFPAGTRFQRVDVPTRTGNPSITIPLWTRNAATGAFTQRNGSLLFLYGYVRAEDGVRRFGWMATEALTGSSDCP